MSKSEFITNMEVSQEVDITEFKFLQIDIGETFVFQKKVAADEDEAYNTKEYGEIQRAIRTTKTYTYYGNTLVPVVNLKISDLWKVNKGEPIHCIASIKSYKVTPAGKLKIGIIPHIMSDEEQPKFRDIQILCADNLCGQNPPTFQSSSANTKWLLESFHKSKKSRVSNNEKENIQ